jgi:hypothetical protein
LNRTSKSSFCVLLLLLLLAEVPAVVASSSPVRTGDRVTYNYSNALIEPLPNGTIYRQAYLSKFSLDVLSVGTSTVPGIIEYTLSYATYQNATVTQTTATGSVNFTYIFDPYDNRSYLGTLGFYPFIYTDVSAGSKEGIVVSQVITGAPNGTISGANRINVTVSRPDSYIDVNFTAKAGVQTQASQTYLRFNATDGVLLYGITKVSLLSVERDFIFRLDSYIQGPSPGIPVLAYAMGGAFGAVAVIAVLDRAGVFRRRGRTRRKEWKGRR